MARDWDVIDELPWKRCDTAFRGDNLQPGRSAECKRTSPQYASELPPPRRVLNNVLIQHPAPGCEQRQVFVALLRPTGVALVIPAAVAFGAEMDIQQRVACYSSRITEPCIIQ